MHGLLKQPGYGSTRRAAPKLEPCSRSRAFGPTDLERALARLESTEGTAVRTILGINEDGVFGISRAGWHPDLPDARKEPFIPILWVKVHELLCRVPEGSTARFIKSGTLPGEAHGDATGHRMAS